MKKLNKILARENVDATCFNEKLLALVAALVLELSPFAKGPFSELTLESWLNSLDSFLEN